MPPLDEIRGTELALVSRRRNGCIPRMPDANSKMLKALERSLADDYRLLSVDAAECPAYFFVAMPVRPAASGAEPRLPCGRGMTRAEAMLSALGEAAELRACLAAESGLARIGYSKRDGLAYVNGETLRTGEPVQLLAQHVFLDWARTAAEPEIFNASTNGCAAYQDIDGATERGLLECVERDARALWWYGRLRCPKLPLHYFDDREPRLSWWLQRRSREFALIDVTCDTLVPSVVAASWEPDGSGISIGSAAAPSLSDAALSATTEMLQTELAMSVGNVPGNEELLGWRSDANAKDLPQLAGEVSVSEPGTVARPIAEHLHDLGRDAVRFDFTAADDVLSAVRMMVPGLSGLRQDKQPQRILDYAARNPSLTAVRSVADLDGREPY
jgi:ribosomal protein S12 methylthiotransferase accessory factor YcaO